MRPFRVAMALMAVGAAARLHGWVTGDSLWLDEIFVANNLRELSSVELLGPLRYGQHAPVAWLLAQKAVAAVFGTGVHALRVLSLAASLVAMPLTWSLARRFLPPRDALVALTLVALGPWVAWQGLQTKQYAVDLAVALGLLLMAVRTDEATEAGEAERGRALVALAGAGLVAVWLSMPSIFVLAGIGSWLAQRAWSSRRARPGRLGAVVAVGALWVAAFGVNYGLFLRSAAEVEWLSAYWAAGFLPWPPRGAGDLLWPAGVVAEALERPLGFVRIGWVALVPVVVGAVLPGRRDRPVPAVLLLCVGWALLAAVLQLHPFRGRLVLFLVPALAILFARGVAGLAEAAGPAGSWVRGCGAALLLVPVGITLLWLPRGGLPQASDTRGLFAELNRAAGAGDRVVVDHVTTHAARYWGIAPTLEVVELPPAWTLEERLRGMVEALDRTAEPTLWFVVAEVSASPAPPLRRALGADLAAGRPTLPATWSWFLEDLRRWAPLPAFQEALPAEWRITERAEVRGGALWRLERRDAPQRLPE